MFSGSSMTPATESPAKCQREVVSIHIGQAGIQLGDSVWELYCTEHGINPDGTLNRTLDPLESLSSFFVEGKSGKYVPLAMMVDLEPSVIDQLRRGPRKSLFNTEYLLNDKEDAANNYARGRFSVGGRILQRTMESIRRLVDNCDNPHGFLFFHSFGGGTGSGFHALLLEEVCAEYPKIQRLQVAILPAPQVSTSVVEPYNAVLQTHATMEGTHCSFLADNEAMYKICQRFLEVESPLYHHLNELVAQVLSSVTASLRFEGSLNVDFNEYQTNLVPFPRIHFPILSYAPITSKRNYQHQSCTVGEITRACFNSNNQMVLCEHMEGKYMACCLLFRGDVVPKEVNNAIQHIKDKHMISFVDWSPAGFKVGINHRPPSVVPGSLIAKSENALCMASNTTAISEAWKRLNLKFDLLFSKKAFVHWFVSEGMEEMEFHEAREDLATLERDYDELANENDCYCVTEDGDLED